MSDYKEWLRDFAVKNGFVLVDSINLDTAEQWLTLMRDDEVVARARELGEIEFYIHGYRFANKNND